MDRSYHFVPSHCVDFLFKVLELAYDVVIYDLEAGVPASMKKPAKRNIAEHSDNKAYRARKNDLSIFPILESFSGMRIVKDLGSVAHLHALELGTEGMLADEPKCAELVLQRAKGQRNEG